MKSEVLKQNGPWGSIPNQRVKRRQALIGQGVVYAGLGAAILTGAYGMHEYANYVDPEDNVSETLKLLVSGLFSVGGVANVVRGGYDIYRARKPIKPPIEFKG